MSTQITITLPDDIYQRAERFARLANRDIAKAAGDSDDEENLWLAVCAIPTRVARSKDEFL